MSDAHLPKPDTDAEHARSLPRARTAPESGTVPPEPAAVPPDPSSLYARVDGSEFFVRLVDAFYTGVAEDQVLRPLYPDPDLAAANTRLRMFLIQYWGGPSTYSATRGHPRLRMRHAPFPVGDAQIQAWLKNMEAALDEVDPEPAIRTELWEYFERAAHFMRNTHD